MTVFADRSRVTAVLGPTNTGKTYLAIERMLGHASGMIGFPLRLLARENYDRIVALRGVASVALITGEERILPKNPRWYVCTVEAMPVDKPVDFLAVDEIQLAADAERGHVFTDRLLHARGRHETMVMGAETIKPLLRHLLPDVEFVTRTRLSQLTYIGPKKLTRLPPRTAVVAFSAAEVYDLAELMRRQRGGCAVVLGALSPRARNAQVGLFQSGEVDYLVATDAIGMGLNMDLDHVAFARLSKFDGFAPRRLSPSEIGQIAGRAGRNARDGTFGPTGEVGPFDPDLIEAIEGHSFESLKTLSWRNSDLDFRSVGALLGSLDRHAPDRCLSRKRNAEDHRALFALARRSDGAPTAQGRAAVRLLWDVCSIPDFTKLLSDGHLRLLSTIFEYLAKPAGRLPPDWVEQQMVRLDRTDGEIDALSARISHIRTWTYITHRADWLADSLGWQERARGIEDRLSDALHQCLTQRFVDKRGAFLVQRLKDPTELLAGIRRDGEVVVEGHPVGRLKGFSFEIDAACEGMDAKRLATAARRALADEIANRVADLVAAPDTAFSLAPDGGLCWRRLEVARLRAGTTPFAPGIEVVTSDLLGPAARTRIQSRLAAFVSAKISGCFAPLLDLRALSLSGAGRGLVHRLIEGVGYVDPKHIGGQLETLSSGDQESLLAKGVRIGRETIYCKPLLSTAAMRLRLLLLAVHHRINPAPVPRQIGARRLRPADQTESQLLWLAGYRLVGPLALRADRVEQIMAYLGKTNPQTLLPATQALADEIGCALEELSAALESLGYRARQDGSVLSFQLRRPKPGREDTLVVTDSPFALLARLRLAGA